MKLFLTLITSFTISLTIFAQYDNYASISQSELEKQQKIIETKVEPLNE